MAGCIGTSTELVSTCVLRLRAPDRFFILGRVPKSSMNNDRYNCAMFLLDVLHHRAMIGLSKVRNLLHKPASRIKFSVCSGNSVLSLKGTTRISYNIENAMKDANLLT